MFKNYLIITFRNLIRQKGYFILNTLGLMIGLTSFIFIFLYVFHETGYDKFHSDYDRIYRVIIKGKMSGQEINQAITAAPMAEAMLKDYPEIESVVRITRQGAWLLQYGNARYNEDNMLFADSSLFEVFDFELIRGNPSTCLREPRSLVLTESIAMKYFGDDDPIGKTIKVEDDTVSYTVTGLMRDVPGNSHFTFDIMASANSLVRSSSTNWISHNYYTYLILEKGTVPEMFEQKMAEMVTKYLGPMVEQYLGINMELFVDEGNYFSYQLQPLSEIHLKSNLQYEIEPNSNISYVYIFSIIGILILVVAVINFINLATAKSASRAREVGIRKVSGSGRKSIIIQFLGESFMLTLIAIFMAVVMVEMLTPSFYNLVGKELSINLFSNNLGIPLLLALFLLVGLLAGIYPAFIISAFKPVDVIKGSMGAKAMSGWLRNVLVIFQFTISITIIIGTILVFNQLHYMQSLNLGFDKEQMLVVRRVDALDNQLESFKEELLRNPAITAVANSTSIPGKPRYSNEGMLLKSDPDQNTYLLEQNLVSYGYAELLGLELSRGRFFSVEYGGDTSSIVINEMATRILGIEEDPIGEVLMIPSGPGTFTDMEIVGIIKDHHIKSLHYDMEPVALTLMPGNFEGYLLIRLSTEEVANAVNYVADAWDSYVELQPFEYFFFDDDYNELYRTEMKTGQLFIVFAFLAIFIASLGLLGLISYSISVRRKEIGIRKVFGAGVSVIVRILSMSIIRLAFLATLFAWPLAFLGIRYWLSDFSNKVAINPLVFLFSTLLVILIGWIVISIQIFMAAQEDPVKTMKYE